MKHLFAVLLIGFTLSAFAQDIEVDGLQYKLLGDGKLEVVGGNVKGNLIIPEKIEYRGRELTITSIGNRAFSEANINSVELPSSIRTIGERAFSNSTVSSINFPYGLYFIEKRAFEGSQLDSIFLPRTLAEHPHWRDTGVAEFAFKGCKKLRVVEFDTEGCASGPGTGCDETNPIRVYAGAFDDCENIETIIYNGEAPIFDPYVDGYKSITFPKIVLEFATLYCPAQNIGGERRFRVDYAMEGFAVIKPTPKTASKYAQYLKNKKLKEKVENQLNIAIKTG